MVCGFLAGSNISWLPQGLVWSTSWAFVLEDTKDLAVPQGPPSPHTSSSGAKSFFFLPAAGKYLENLSLEQ